MKSEIKKNKFRVAFLIIVINSCFSLDLYAQHIYHFKEFEHIEKLSNTKIRDMFQDSYGFMWLATDDGLNRYDGKNVRVYKNIQGNDNSLPDNATMKVIEDSDKNIWVACYNTIGKLDRKTDKFTKYTLDHLPYKSPPTFYRALLDQQGRIWFAGSELGLIRFDESLNHFISVALSEKNSKNIWGEVHSVYQLKNGLILAADVSDGLKAFNSVTDKFDPYYLKPNYSPNRIYHIYEGNDGIVWFAGSEIFLKYSPAQYVVKEIDLLSYSKINSNYYDHNGIVEDKNGNLWIGIYTHGLFKIDKQLNIVQQYVNNPGNLNSIPDNKVSEIYKDKYGVIWLTFFSGGVTQLDPDANPFDFLQVNLPGKNNNQTIVSSIVPLPGSSSSIMIGTNSAGILEYKINTRETLPLNLQDVAIKKDSNNAVNALAVDYLGNIWYSINGSELKKYNPITKKIEIIKSPHQNKTAQPLNIVSIDLSPDNKIWISSNYGVDQYDPVTKQYFSVPRIMNKTMSDELRNEINNIRESRNALSSILEVGEGQNLEESFKIDEDKKVILISVGEGRAIGGMFDRGRLLNPAGEVIWDMIDIYKTFYDGGGFKNRIGIKTLELTAGQYNLSYYSDVGHSYKSWNTLAPDDSTYWGVEAYELSNDEYVKLTKLIERDINNNRYLPFEIGRLVDFSKAHSGTVWIGSSTNSFFKYDLSSKTYKQYNFNTKNLTDAKHYIYCFYEDLEGTFWVGTYSSLVRVDGQTDSLVSFTTADGLPGGNIYSITEDFNGALWIYSSGGLSKLNKNAPLDEYSFVNYDLKDGLEGLTPSSAVWKDEEGRIYFGGKGGMISFIPGTINTVKPDIVVNDFKLDDVSVFDDSANFVLDKGIYESDLIELSYDQNNIAFEFATIHFSRPGKNRISYKLEGFNNKWYESDRNFVSFTNLDAGEYTFKVIGSNGDGIWNNTGREIDIIIYPPWWLTTYAYIGYGVTFLLLIFLIDRIQRRRLLSIARQKMKMQEAVHRAESAELQSRAVQAENERKSKELEEARELQLSMLPKALPELPNLDIAVYMKTATEVGGDYYDFNVSIDGTLTVVLGDATGHGMKAGTMVTTVKGLFNSYANNNDILFTFHEMSRCIKQMHFQQLSMCLTMLKIQGNKLLMSAAGMPPIFIYRQSDKKIDEEVIKGMPLGTMSDFPYEVRDTVLNNGDTILLMSDGFPELLNNNDEQYGYKKSTQ
jgi:ligand-binding sensor domain-containing protein